ncbi:MAG: ABC transporter permease [Eubacteriales bacterium]|nr:ABC transporter permease [Eubacteriales bacterium]
MKKLLHSRNTGLILVLVILLVVARFITPGMFSVYSMINMLQNNGVYALLAIGEMVVILTGGIDISIASQLAFVGIVTTSLSGKNPGVPGFVWVLVAVLLGALCGALNGFLVGYLHMVPMICTLGTMYIFRGLAFVVSGGQWWFAAHYLDSYRFWAIAKVGGQVPLLIILVVLIMIIVGLFLGYTAPGRRIYAIGTSRESSAVAGIKEEKVTFYSFVICGALAGLAGMMYTANYAIGYYGMGESFEMTAIAICVLGGVSITGGKGRMDGVAIGVLIMAVVTYFISMIPGMSVWQKAFQGGIIIAAVAINYFTERSAAKQALKERGALI